MKICKFIKFSRFSCVICLRFVQYCQMERLNVPKSWKTRNIGLRFSVLLGTLTSNDYIAETGSVLKIICGSELVHTAKNLTRRPNKSKTEPPNLTIWPNIDIIIIPSCYLRKIRCYLYVCSSLQQQHTVV